MKSRLIKLERLPIGIPLTDDFKTETEELKPLTNGQLLLQPLYISVDPYLRAKMSGGHQPRLNAGDVMYSRGVAKVVESKHENFKPGDFITGFMQWRDVLVLNGNDVILLDPQDTPLSAYLGILGSTGLSAYFALRDIGKPKAGDTMVVSGAAGAVGSVAGQIGKLMGCKVIGIAGSNEKTNFIKETLAFDEAINYKTTADLARAFADKCPQGIDIYFDNVGGEIADAAISQINDYGRIVVCGAISSYNDTHIETGPRLLPYVVFKKLLIQGFLIADYKDQFSEGIDQLRRWLAEGKLHNSETIVQGFEKLPEAFIGLFTGRNEGKMIVKNLA